MTAAPEGLLDLSAIGQDLLDVVGCGVWIYDGTDTRYVNRELSVITGFSVEELLAPDFFANLIHPEDREMIVERGKARVRGEPVPETYEVRVIAKSGEVRTLALTARRLELGTGPVSLVSAVDVTPLHKAQDAIRVGSSAVLDLLHSLPAHVITTDVEGKPTFVNRHWLELTGQTEAEALESGTARLIHPDDLAMATKRWRQALRTGESYSIDYRVRDARGEYRWQNFRIRALTGPDGERLGWTAASVDIHDEKELAEKLAAANEELARAVRAKDEVLGLISHELRTPLTTLIGNARLLKRHDGSLSVADRLAVADDLEADALRLENVIANMLILSRTGTDEAVESEPLRLHILAAEVIREHRQRHADREIMLVADPALPLAVGNAVHYRQVLSNLLTNAHKYSPLACPVRVELSHLGDMIQTSVIDAGQGLSDEDRERVFDAFFRSASHSKTYGIGLGLTVCRRLVQVHGGTISVRNLDAVGCAFEFTTPVLGEHDASD